MGHIGSGAAQKPCHQTLCQLHACRARHNTCPHIHAAYTRARTKGHPNHVHNKPCQVLQPCHAQLAIFLFIQACLACCYLRGPPLAGGVFMGLGPSLPVLAASSASCGGGRRGGSCSSLGLPGALFAALTTSRTYPGSRKLELCPGKERYRQHDPDCRLRPPTSSLAHKTSTTKKRHADPGPNHHPPAR